MKRVAYFVVGAFSLLLGMAGVLIPLLPTVPFVILAAFCFARGSPRLETWLVEHRRFGPHIQAWRSRGAISPPAKRAALFAFAFSAVLGFVLLDWPWSVVPLLVAAAGGSWVVSRPGQ